tara:strand:- start:111 stop:344 length:234 start_codon:yes stop_codon:yes gene_type:complete
MMQKHARNFSCVICGWGCVKFLRGKQQALKIQIVSSDTHNWKEKYVLASNEKFGNGVICHEPCVIRGKESTLRNGKL